MGWSQLLFKCCYFRSDGSCISNNPFNMSHLPSSFFCLLERWQTSTKWSWGGESLLLAMLPCREETVWMWGASFCRDPWEFSILGRSKQQNLSAWWLVAASSCRLLGPPQGSVFLIKCILVKRVVQRKYNPPRGVFAPQLQSQLHWYMLVEIWNKWNYSSFEVNITINLQRWIWSNNKIKI